MSFHKTQRLNDWVEMLHQVYGRTQNYAKSDYEIHTHITEVCGAFGKYLFKRRQPDRALEFLPKMFSWATALFKKVKGAEADLESVILTKFPRLCPYCCAAPCECWSVEKPRLDAERVRSMHFRNAANQKRSVNDFQLMFREIYEASWKLDPGIDPTGEAALGPLRRSYSRLVEELSEMAEAMRLHHLYPSNFDNEIADYFAWWFALASSVHTASVGREVLLAEDLLWAAYPGYCADCTLCPCDCRPGPVRELLSKPALNDLSMIDALTQAGNRRAFDVDVAAAKAGSLRLTLPVTCVRIDVDHFKEVNNNYSHLVGDDALTHLVTIMRQRMRPRDRLYRVGGDEFAVLCPDLSVKETEGMIGRVQQALKERPVLARQAAGEKPAEIVLTVSVGIAECTDASTIETSFSAADDAAIQSKEGGRDRCTIATTAAAGTPAVGAL